MTAAKKRLPRNVLALSVVSCLTDVSSEMIYSLLPVFLTKELGAKPMTLGFIEGAAETVASFLKLASGWWSDKVTRRKPIVVLGYTIATVARPFVAVAQTWGAVLAIRVSDRVGKGIRTSPRDALIADSVDASGRGRAFGFHRAADHAGAVVGPLLASLFLYGFGVQMRTVFWLSAIPGVLAVLALVALVKDIPREGGKKAGAKLAGGFGGRFWAYLAVLFLFTLGNSTDAFLLLRASDLGVPLPLVPLLWALLHVVKSTSSTPAGALSDRVGRRPLIVAGWAWYALVYVGFAFASATWHAWALFAAYGVFFGLTEGVEKALVADLAPSGRSGGAFGWFNLTVGLAALPGSLLFGWVWENASPKTAFTMGAGLAGLAVVGLFLVVRGAPRESRTK